MLQSREANNKPKGGTHAGIDAAAPASYLEPGRLCRDLARRNARSSRAIRKAHFIGPITRQVAARAKRVANALDALGVGRGDRVATLAWNSYRHLEIYYGVTCSGRVLHTVNPRLFPEQLQYIMHHAEDAYRLLRSGLRAAGRAAGAAAAAGARLDRALRAEGMPAVKAATCSATKTCWRRRRPITSGRTSTRTRPRRSATPRARRAIRRACSTAIARRCCTPSPPAPPTVLR